MCSKDRLVDASDVLRRYYLLGPGQACPHLVLYLEHNQAYRDPRLRLGAPPPVKGPPAVE